MYSIFHLISKLQVDVKGHGEIRHIQTGGSVSYNVVSKHIT